MRRSIQRRGLSTAQVVLIVVGSLLLVSCMVIALMAGLLLPALAKARDTAKTLKSQTQIAQIIREVDRYQRDHAGQAPPDLQALFDVGYITRGIEMSPFGPTTDGQGDYWVDFTLGSEGIRSSGGRPIVCLDRAMLNSPQRRVVAVGYADGTTNVVDRAVAEQFLNSSGSSASSTQPATSR